MMRGVPPSAEHAAVARIGAVLGPINFMLLAPPEVAHILRHSGAT
jgi:ABC-type enterobactin transport system permease subunit